MTLKALGLLLWQRRIVRSGNCVDQVSNAYALMTPDGDPSDGQNGQRVFKRKNYSSSLLSMRREISDEEMDAMARTNAAQQILQLGGADG